MRPPQANRQFTRPQDTRKQIQRMKKSEFLQKPQTPHKPAKTKPEHSPAPIPTPQKIQPEPT